MRSRIIDKDQAGEIDRWDVPSVDATAADALRGAQKVSAHLLTAGQLDALQKQVHDEAFKRGFDEGLATGKAELASRVARLAALAESFSQPFQSLERSVEEELVNLSVELASHLVRHEIAHDPALLHSAINDCLGVLASTVREITLHLNPEDAALIRAEIQAGTETRFAVAEDTALQRGDLRITSGSALVDGRLSARCAEIIAVARAG